MVLVPDDERDGEEREHYAISSPQFAEFTRVEHRRPDGTIFPAES